VSSSSLYHNEALNDLDRILITKAFDSIQNAIEKVKISILENDEDVKKVNKNKWNSIRNSMSSYFYIHIR
jgi:hypothetical protein